MKKASQLWMCFLPVVAVVSGQYLVQQAMHYLLLRSFMKDNPGDMQSWYRYSDILLNSTDFLTRYMIVYEILALAVSVLIYVFAMQRKPGRLSLHFTRRSFPAMLLLFLGIEPMVSLCLGILQMFFPKLFEEYLELIDTMGLNEMGFFIALVSIVLAPIAEELIFRGITLKLAEDSAGKFWIANIIQAACFGIAHMNIVQGVYAFLMGLVLGAVFDKYRTILAPMFCHIVFNVSGTYLITYLFRDTENPAYVLLTEAGIMVVLCIGLLLFIRDRGYKKNIM